MMYYTDNNQIKELMTNFANVEVKDLGTLESLTNVTVYLFDTHFFTLHLPDTKVRSDFLLLHRPDWGGIILEMMKKND